MRALLPAPRGCCSAAACSLSSSRHVADAPHRRPPRSSAAAACDAHAASDDSSTAAVRDATVLVVGGGFAGVGCATALAAAGVDVLLCEQGRGLGGRVCTRHTRALPGAAWDHGAQYLAPRGGALHALLPGLAAAGVVARWGQGGRLGELACGPDGRLQLSSYRPQDPSKEAYVGVPGMSAVGRHLVAAAGARITVATGTRVAPGSLRRCADSAWEAGSHAKGADATRLRTTRHAAVVAAGSASSTYNVIAPVAPQLAAAAAGVRADACWGLLAAFAGPLPPAPFDGALISGSAELSWIARDSSKPGRGGSAECWVAHATPGWSNAHRDAPADEARARARLSLTHAALAGTRAPARPAQVAAALLAALLRALGVDAPPAVLYSEAHRWNAAFPLNPTGAPGGCYADAEARLAMCGDWCIGPRAGDAFESGRAAAAAVLAML